MALAVLTSSLGVYVLAKFDLRGKTILFIATLGSMMIPGNIMLILRYIVVALLNRTDTYAAIIVFQIFLMRQYMQGVRSD